MEKMILVDRGLRCLSYVINFTSINIEALIVDSDSEKTEAKEICKSRLNSVYTVAEIDCIDSIDGLDFETVEGMKGTQLKAENALVRYLGADYQIKKLHYYEALSFWTKIFKECLIDLVFINGVSHGLLYDGVLIGCAKYFGVRAYTTNGVGLYGICNNFESFFYNEKSNKICKIENAVKINKIKDYYFVSNEKNVLNFPFERRQFNIVFRKIYKKLGFLGSEFIRSLICKRLLSKTQMGSSGFEETLFQKYSSYKKLLKAKKHLSTLEAEPNENDKFFYYALHFEPEGTTQTRVTMESQLTIIKLLSECIPEGYFLYVKEHPHQFKLNNDFLSYYMYNAEYFKTKAFYDTISKLKRVKLINRSVNGAELAKRSLGVATICGSILFEAAEMNKPILLFSDKHPFVEYPQVFKCFSYLKCKDAVEQIIKGFVPDYSDILENLNAYVNSSDDDWKNNFLRILNGDI